MRRRLCSVGFDHVFTSPLRRARRMCELAGFGDVAVIDPDLAEWDYGAFEGKRTADIHMISPGWQLFRDGCPGGESVCQVSARADRVVVRLRGCAVGNMLVFSSGHILRMIAVRWLELDPQAGALFALDTASISILGYGHHAEEPVIRLWNDVIEF
jgi:probable phosphoglycerate mutase